MKTLKFGGVTPSCILRIVLVPILQNIYQKARKSATQGKKNFPCLRNIPYEELHNEIILFSLSK